MRFLFEKPYLNKKTKKKATITSLEPVAKETKKKRANKTIVNFVFDSFINNNAANAIEVNEENAFGFQIIPLYLPENTFESANKLIIITPKTIYTKCSKNLFL